VILAGAATFGLVFGWHAVLVFRQEPQRWYRRLWPIFGPLVGASALALFPAPGVQSAYGLGVVGGMLAQVMLIRLLRRRVRHAPS